MSSFRSPLEADAELLPPLLLLASFVSGREDGPESFSLYGSVLGEWDLWRFPSVMLVVGSRVDEIGGGKSGKDK